MKMRFTGILTIALLSIVITFYGVNEQVFAESHNVPPISISTEFTSYEEGDTVNVIGSIRSFDPDRDSNKAVTVLIKSPDGNLVGVGQVIPDSDGVFNHSFVIGGNLWKAAGEYIIESTFDAHTIDTTLLYAGNEPPPEIVCGPNQERVGDTCIDIPPPPPPPEIVCGPNQERVGDTCIDIPPPITCGEGTQLVNGTCIPIPDEEDDPKSETSGCLIATAAYGSELAPQVQFLREVRDNTVLSTSSGVTFMTAFNQLYYSFSPTIADMERENPAFRDAVRTMITPMITSLGIMTLADPGSEIEVLGFGISVIMLNLGLYIAAPALIGFKVYGHLKSRR